MPEQISIIDRLRRRRQRRIDANIRAATIVREPLPPLPPFSSGESTCKKCGNVDEAGIRYSRHGDYGDHNSRHTGGREAMIRTCPTCGYEWPESLPTGDPNA